mmetsp:Transcript_7881/g.16123  ORF Transcript_7881/g.16123 Transcript_7881/m.16123 type:complete len:81 (-) Transcript_7881:946-1188(-)
MSTSNLQMVSAYIQGILSFSLPFQDLQQLPYYPAALFICCFGIKQNFNFQRNPKQKCRKEDIRCYINPSKPDSTFCVTVI